MGKARCYRKSGFRDSHRRNFKSDFLESRREYKKIKGLKRENLRDHMDDLELLFTQLGEAATTQIARTDDARGMEPNKDAARRGGAVAGTARKQLERNR